MSTMTEEPSIRAAAGSPSRTPFLRRSERAALIISPEVISHARLLNRLLPGGDKRPRQLPNRVLGLDAAGFPAAVPGIDPAIGIEPLQNLHVMFVAERLEHHVVSGGVFQSRIFWDGNGPQSVTQELDGPWSWLLPPPDEVDILPPAHSAIYQGLTTGGCMTLPFPITLNSWIVEEDTGAQIGSVSLTDNTTLAQPGFYDFWYEIPVTGSNNGRSRFVISGAVLVQCTNTSVLGG